MKLADVELDFNFNIGAKRELNLKINGNKIECVKSLQINIPVEEVPTMTVELYMDSLNIAKTDSDLDVIMDALTEKIK
ncbi:hypothetical protein [Peptostreptococcus faecalis]|uniref:hypothetical protein n=1 Tax=Peptostreptococcus faecalis TaxID=2045015 RepID=UPI000C7B4676|nr:hypothetical protein [Peptostreptococcus faecalis]